MKQKEKQRRKKLRKLAQFELELNARAGYLLVKEMEFDRRLRNKTLRMARKRKVNYIQ